MKLLENTIEEIWKPIKGYEGLYEISNLGRVKSCRKWSGTCFRQEKMLSNERLTKDGYVRVNLHRDNRGHEFRVHRLVAEHFIPNPTHKDTVNHIDGNKLNNTASNLEWADRHEQLNHAYRLKLKQAHRGSSNTQAKLTDDDVRYIRKHYIRNSREFGTVALSKKFGVSNRVIGLVVAGKSYKNVK